MLFRSEPTYQSGDLVWSRCGDAAVGDIVVYTPPDTDGARVIHRIIGGDGVDGWTLQGDNNSFIDPWSPDDSLVVGVAAVHVPRLGSLVYILANPYIWGSLLIIATAIYLWPRTESDADPTARDGETADPTDTADAVPAHAATATATATGAADAAAALALSDAGAMDRVQEVAAQ